MRVVEINLSANKDGSVDMVFRYDEWEEIGPGTRMLKSDEVVASSMTSAIRLAKAMGLVACGEMSKEWVQWVMPGWER